MEGILARVLVTDDDASIARVVRDRLRAAGHDVAVASDGSEAIELVADIDVMVLDLNMPMMDGQAVLDTLRTRESAPSVVVITTHGSVQKAVDAMRAGAFDFVEKPFDLDHLTQVVKRAAEHQRLSRRVAALHAEVDDAHAWVRGPDPGMAQVATMIERVAPTEATVLLTGETGTGKEVLARALHRESTRSGGPFVAINCAALSEELLESELFGHEQGAFTGAVNARAGRLETAAGGTLFLDEVGELSPKLQAKLLRVLQERTYERLGGDTAIKADVRIVAATNRDLQDGIAAGNFREDLYFRLKVIAIHVPALRDRPSDIPVLAQCSLGKHAGQLGRPTPEIGEAALAALTAYPWPGNVRELSNVMQRCAILGGECIELVNLPEELHTAPLSVEPSSAAPDALFQLPYNEAVELARVLILRQALEATDGHQTRAAERLGLTQPYMSRLMKKLGLRKPD